MTRPDPHILEATFPHFLRKSADSEEATNCDVCESQWCGFMIPALLGRCWPQPIRGWLWRCKLYFSDCKKAFLRSCKLYSSNYALFGDHHGLTESDLTEQSWQMRSWQNQSWQNQSWQNQIWQNTELTESELTEYGVDRIRVDRMRSWQNQTWQNQTWQNKIWQNQTWQNKIWQNQTWQNIFYCKISNFCKYKFPYFASKKGVQIFTTISKVCRTAQIFSKVIKFRPKISLQILTKIFKTCSERNDIVPTSDEGLQKINSFLSCSNSCQLRILSTFNLFALLGLWWPQPIRGSPASTTPDQGLRSA